MDNKLQVSTCKITSTKYKRPTTKNVEQRIEHLLTSEIDFLLPSDRGLSFCVEGIITHGDIVDVVVEITPIFIHIKEECCNQMLHKSIIFKTMIPLKFFVETFTKEIRWVLQYFGLTIMYIQKSFKRITIEKTGQGYTIEYSKK